MRNGLMDYWINDGSGVWGDGRDADYTEAGKLKPLILANLTLMWVVELQD